MFVRRALTALLAVQALALWLLGRSSYFRQDDCHDDGRGPDACGLTGAGRPPGRRRPEAYCGRVARDATSPSP
jgi:hypothetical protein